MKYMIFWAVLLVALIFSTPLYALDKFDNEMRDEVVALFGTILAPSIFTTASLDQLTISVYGRTLTDEGVVPDFDGDIESEIDQMTIYASGRLSGLGFTLGFGQGSDFEFSQPVILSADYKVSLVNDPASAVDAAIDLQYSTIALPKEENIKVSTLGFGVISINGLISAKIMNLLEPYGGLTLNYIYLNSDLEGNISVWKPIPKVGLRLNILQVLSAATEITFIKNSHIDSAWAWNIGASLRF